MGTEEPRSETPHLPVFLVLGGAVMDQVSHLIGIECHPVVLKRHFAFSEANVDMKR